MPRMFDVLSRLVPWRRQELKASATGPVVSIGLLGQPVWTPRDYAAFAREGFMQNAVVYRSVRMIAEAAASIPLLLYEGEEEVTEHPLLDLIRRPNAEQTSTDFLESWYGFLLVSGNAYCEAVAAGNRLRELHALRPDRMRVIPGADGWPEGYEYTAGGRSVRFEAEPVRDVRPILHVRLFHPANDHYGMSPIEAAATAIDIHNTASGWNKALLDNAARPSGALVLAAREGRLTGEQYERLKDELEAGFQGARNAGRPLLLEGGLDWRPLSLSPKDMDFIEAKNTAAREIALALGVPPMLLGIPGDNTYANLQEATRSFWRQTVLPLADRTAKALSGWLAPAWGQALLLKPDLDQIEALASEREALWSRLEAASFLSANEKRAAVGYGPLDEDETGTETDARVALKYSPDQPRVPAGSSDGGQWTSGGGSESAEETTASGEGSDYAVGGDEGDRLGYRIDLLEEEAAGGHTISEHVGKSDAYLLRRMQVERLETPFLTIARQRVGTFHSVEAANKLVGATLMQNGETVGLVASGKLSEGFVRAEFSSPTGREAYASSARSQPYIRETYGVGVKIIHDPMTRNGFRVISAYPRNE